MTTLSTRALGALTALVAAVSLTGCAVGFDNMGQGFGGSFTLVGLVVLILDVLAILDVWKSNRDSGSKLIWTLVIFFLPVLGLLLYYLMGRR